MPEFNAIICIGNGTPEADAVAQSIVKKYNAPYYGVLDTYSELLAGGYHTSIFDIKLQELRSKIENFNGSVKLIVLDQSKSYYQVESDYYDTLNLGQRLESIADVEFVNPTMYNSIIRLLEDNKSFCIMPFMAIYVCKSTSTGKASVKSCCYMPTPLTDDYENFKTDAQLNRVRNDMLKGNVVPECSYCTDLENMGMLSPRHDRTYEWSQRLGINTEEDLHNKMEIKYSDVRLNNECNLLCRSCNPGESHLIDKEYVKIGWREKPIGIRESMSYDIINLDTVDQVYVAGGEPSINNDFFNFLKKCIAENKTDIELVINTNAAVISDKYVDLLRHFSNLAFEISIDGFDKLNYYIRWPTIWTKLANNVRTLHMLSNGRVSFNTVASIYNMGRLYEIFEYLEKNYPDNEPHVSILAVPEIQQAINFPDKSFAIKDLERTKTLNIYKKSAEFKSKIDGLISEIKKTPIDLKLLDEFFKFNDRLDLSRNVELKDYNPELDVCRELITKQI